MPIYWDTCRCSGVVLDYNICVSVFIVVKTRGLSLWLSFELNPIELS